MLSFCKRYDDFLENFGVILKIYVVLACVTWKPYARPKSYLQRYQDQTSIHHIFRIND